MDKSLMGARLNDEVGQVQRVMNCSHVLFVILLEYKTLKTFYISETIR